MKAIVVYESMFGNTRHIADAVAEGLRQSIDVETMVARDAVGLDLTDVQLVVAGAPTHALGLSRSNTRAAALDATKHPDQLVESSSVRTGMREWLHGLPRQYALRRGVAFDTRYDKPKVITGSAAKVIQRGLRAAGFAGFGEPHSFLVDSMTGPLVAGEVERARQWGEAMGRMLVGMNMALALPSRARL